MCTGFARCNSEQSVHLKNCIELLSVLLLRPRVTKQDWDFSTLIPYLMQQKSVFWACVVLDCVTFSCATHW